ncbi:hypothetical protein GW17_00040408 [Ensete ventricosum]|nr:hypothetical protein GW17_00040408 [Ensete ventricosum]
MKSLTMLRPHYLRRGGGDISSMASDEGGRRRIGIVEGERHRISKFSLFFSLLSRLIPLGSRRQRSKSTITDRFQAETRQKQPQSDPHVGLLADRYVPPDTGGTIRYCRPWVG